MIKFEKISKYADVDIPLPVRKTANAAGYDFVVAEDTYVPSYHNQFARASKTIDTRLTLDEVAHLTKRAEFRPTLVPTGIKCSLDPHTYLELTVRSSSPLKYWLLLANGVGVIDADYYNNESNEGHIYFQIINLSPWGIMLKKGDIIGQGIIKHYLITDEDMATGVRTGGFGSTNETTGS